MSDLVNLLQPLARAGMESVIATKEAMNRPRDREAIHQLKALRKLRREGS